MKEHDPRRRQLRPIKLKNAKVHASAKAANEAQADRLEAEAIGRLLRAVLGDGKRVKVNPWDTKRKRKK